MDTALPHIALDTETYWSKKLRYSVRNLLPEHYASHNLFSCYMVSACDGSTAWAGEPEKFRWESLEGRVLVSHNARHDQAVVREMIKRGQIPDFKPAAWYCSAAMSAYLFNRRSLAEAVERAFKVKLSKDVREDSAEKHWPADYTAEQQKQMLDYARSDAHWTWKLWNDFSERWPEHEKLIANWHIERGREGVQIDEKLLNDYILKAHACKLKTQELLPWLSDEWDEEDEFNQKPTSTKCIAEECRRVGIPAPPVKAHEGEDAFQEWEAAYGEAHPWIGALSNWRSINKLLKTFERMKERLSDSGAMPFGQKYVGTMTGRVSGEMQVNLFNQRKFGLLIDSKGLLETDDLKISSAHKERKKTGDFPSWVQSIIDARNLIIARPGKILCTSDLSNIEPRVAAHIAGDTAFLDLVRAGHSPYAAHAIATMGWDPARDLKTEDPEQYNLAKMRCVAHGTPVITKRGYVEIQDVQDDDLVWDGVEWVGHEGLICKGEQPVIKLGHEFFTEDHEIYEAENEKKTARAYLSQRRCAWALHWRQATSPGWREIWQLGSFVFRSVAKREKVRVLDALLAVWKRFRKAA